MVAATGTALDLGCDKKKGLKSLAERSYCNIIVYKIKLDIKQLHARCVIEKYLYVQ